ncbi:MAG: ribosome maturation factor RimM [Bacteroidia bacterium]|nr:ribosome maturation factor RimM [Bacteroidia bacterium]
MDKLQPIGKIGKTHGIKGFVSIHLNDNIDVDWDSLRSFFIMMDNVPVPYIVDDIEFLPQKIIVKFQGINSVNEAKQFTNKLILLPENLILLDDTLNYVGYLVMDVNQNNHHIGYVKEVIVNNNLEWLVIENQHQKEILLPFNENLIEQINHQEKQIFYKAIEGMY